MLKILLPSGGEIAYKRAGEAFRDMWQAVTGSLTELLCESEYSGEGDDLVLIGSDAVNDRTASLFARDIIESLGIRYGTDDYAIRSARCGDVTCLVLAGGRGRSTLYAVYDYFERAAGCRYFWDGDVIPHHDTLPLAGFDVCEKPRFEYRGLRYFAHRGLHRFQAEHWSLADWKREIDWMVKRRLNYFMLRIGMDDVFQRAFPDVVDYPSASKKLPEATAGYDDRSLFWPLEYRSTLRKKLLEYARERDIMHSEDCGTMTHWYCRTPIQFLEKKKPVLLSQTSGGYSEQTGLVWDPRIKENLDNYLKITDVYANYYGTPQLFHTIGLAERNISADRRENLKIKLFTYRRILQNIREKYPQSKMLIAAWDFIGWWRKEEIQQLINELDPQRTIILDYMCEHDDPEQAFLSWGVVGKFPWIIGMFHAYESESDIRGPYDRTKERLKIADADPMCKGMVMWPELSHSDTLALEYLARNSWRPEEDTLTIETLAGNFVTSRYPAEDVPLMNDIWQTYLPMVKLVEWGHYSRRTPDDPDYVKYCHNWWDNRVFLYDMLGVGCIQKLRDSDMLRWDYLLGRVREEGCAERGAAILAKLAGRAKGCGADGCNQFLRRDMYDIAISIIGRLSHWGIMRLCLLRSRFEKSETSLGGEMISLVAALRELAELLCGIVCGHEDYSMYATLKGMDEVSPVSARFEETLKQNLVNGYCRQACSEAYRYLFLDEQRVYFDWVEENVRAGMQVLAGSEPQPWTADFGAKKRELFEDFMARPLAEMACAVRTCGETASDKSCDYADCCEKAAALVSRLGL
ncbi:MAG: hypothetical protein GX628_04480 [Clostridiales bacterium]|nr:hypothetical protein [Clostridiales bacterium]